MASSRHFILSRRHAGFVIAAFTLFLILSYLVIDRFAPAGRRLAKITGEDTVGYFGIAHSILFDQDFNLNNEYARMPPANREHSPVLQVSGLPANHWPIGYSLLQLPFLAFGTLIDAVAGAPPDGYSQYALIAYGLGNIVWTGTGLFVLFHFLCEVGSFWKCRATRTPALALFVVLLTYFGTNLAYYSFAQLSHASTALFASVFLFQWWKVRSSNDVLGWLLLGFAGGFLSICRWQDCLFLLAPLVYDLTGGEWRAKPMQWALARAAYSLAAVTCWIPQLMEWKSIYGSYLTNPFQANYSSFPPTHIFKVLFSSQNGWLIWTPLIALGITGLAYGALRASRIYLPWILIIVLELVLVGSLSIWHGGDSFSARYLTATTPILSLGLFTLFCALPDLPRRFVGALSLLCCLFSVLFVFQYRFDLIPREATLTVKELFSDKFHIPRVRQQKIAVQRARQLIAEGDTKAAATLLGQAASVGDDRDVLGLLLQVTRSIGTPEAVAAVEKRRQAYAKTILY
jgi:hypothetical protein